MRSFALVGEFTVFMADTARSSTGFWRRRSLFVRQCERIGVSSSGILAVAAVFLGGVLGYELYVGFSWFGAEELIGASVGVSLFRDLAAVMTGIMVTGRAASAMAAEIASMRISEQIDALEVMAVDPLEYLVVPRVVAGALMVPILGVFFGAVASLSAAGVTCGMLGLSYATFWEQFTKYMDFIEVVHCLVKSCTFGLVLASVGCFCGYRARGGAAAVGAAAQTTVVVSLLGILLADYILTTLLPITTSTLKVT